MDSEWRDQKGGVMKIVILLMVVLLMAGCVTEQRFLFVCGNQKYELLPKEKKEAICGEGFFDKAPVFQ